MKPTLKASPTRRYMVMCNKTNWDGVHFIRLTLPKNMKNSIQEAQKFFIDNTTQPCINTVMAMEDYENTSHLNTGKPSFDAMMDPEKHGYKICPQCNGYGSSITHNEDHCTMCNRYGIIRA